MGNTQKLAKMQCCTLILYIAFKLFIFSVYMYMFIPVSKVFACLFDSKFLSFICWFFFFIVARNIHYQMSSFNENSAFGLIKHSCVELLAYPCMTYRVYSLDVCLLSCRISIVPLITVCLVRSILCYFDKLCWSTEVVLWCDTKVGHS